MIFQQRIDKKSGDNKSEETHLDGPLESYWQKLRLPLTFSSTVTGSLNMLITLPPRQHGAVKTFSALRSHGAFPQGFVEKELNGGGQTVKPAHASHELSNW